MAKRLDLTMGGGTREEAKEKTKKREGQKRKGR